MRRYFFLAMATLAVLVAPTAWAASIRLVPTSEQGSSHLTVDVLFDPEGADANAMGGTITFDPTLLSLSGIDDGPAIGMWVDAPALTTPGAVAFSGITPGGFGSGLTRVCTLRLQAKATGTAQFATQDLALFADDGKATPLPIRGTTVQVAVAGYPPSDLTAPPADTQPPEPFTPQFGRDPSIEHGAWFVAFVATDKGNGIAEYQVLESDTQLDPAKLNGSETGWRTAQSPYVLRDQSRQSWIYVRAVDRNGNARVEMLAPANVSEGNVAAVGGVMMILGLVLAALILLLRRLLRRRSHL